MFRYVVLITVLLFSLTCVATGISFAEDEVLAKVGNKEVTMSDLNRIIGYLDIQKQQMIEKNPQYKEQLLNQLVQSIVLSDLAKKAGYEKKADINEKLEFLKDNFLASEYVQREFIDKVTVSEDEMKSYYDSHKDEFTTPESVHVRHILIKVDKDASEEDKQKAREKAEDLLAKIKAGEDFEKVASEFSDDTTTKSKGGDLGFITKGRVVKQFEDAAFALKPGEVSGVIETAFGYHIIKVDEKKDESIEPYETAKESIKQKLLKERLKSEVPQYINKVLKDAGAEFHTEWITGTKE